MNNKNLTFVPEKTIESRKKSFTFTRTGTVDFRDKLLQGSSKAGAQSKTF